MEYSWIFRRRRLQSPVAECADSRTIGIKYSSVSGSGVGDVLCLSEVHRAWPWERCFRRALSDSEANQGRRHGVGSPGSATHAVIKCAGDLKTGSLGVSPQLTKPHQHLSHSVIQRLHHSHFIDEEVMPEERNSLPMPPNT